MPGLRTATPPPRVATRRRIRAQRRIEPWPIREKIQISGRGANPNINPSVNRALAYKKRGTDFRWGLTLTGREASANSGSASNRALV